ncbi:AAA ATPase midasin, partial [Teratosphaeriaceae sp. CCFEE 6253]
MGSACVSLWAALRLPTPRSMEQLHAIIAFEQIVHRFDQACGRFEQSVTNLTDTRMMFARTLKAAVANTASLGGLSEQLDTLLTASGTATGNASRMPHFAQAFESLSQHAALLILAGHGVSDDHVTAVELLALRPTSQSILNVTKGISGYNVSGQLALLSRLLPLSSTTHGQANTHRPLSTILPGIADVARVTLRDLGLLEAEISVLGHSFGRYAHLLVMDRVTALDCCLRRIVLHVLTALASHTSDTRLKAMSTRMLMEFESESHHTITLSRPADYTYCDQDHEASLAPVASAFNTVLKHLISPAMDPVARLKQASGAWTALGMVCLVLYLPQAPFDPALQPIIERDVHRQCLRDIGLRLSALQTFRAAMTGEADSLRGQSLQEDVVQMGPEPVVDEVCRPTTSAISELQAEFDGLLRALPSAQQSLASQLAGDALLWTNLDQIRDRLHQQYRAYSDLTGPVIGFIDCMRLGRHFAIDAEEAVQGNDAASLRNIIPFVGASLRDWSSEQALVLALDSHLGERETLLALSVMAARTEVLGSAPTSPALLLAIDHHFENIYDLWRSKLNEDQRESTARSSLYRYQGDTDSAEEAWPEEISALFPSQDETVTTAHPLGEDADDFSLEIARLHGAVFRGCAHGPETLSSLVEQYAKLTASTSAGPESAFPIPTIIWSLQSTAYSLRGNNETEKAYNIYTDSNIHQVKQAREVIANIQSRFADLHATWPEHATPIEVQRICDQVLDVGHAEPLVRFLSHMEKLHATMNQWQQIASREYSVVSEVEQLTSLIVSWRQLELSSWAGLLDGEDSAARKDSSSWWYIAYENVVAAVRALRQDPVLLRAHIESLLETLESFIGSCGLAEFAPRLDMLRGFEAHLAMMVPQDHAWHSVQQALANFIAYHEPFQRGITDKLSKGRATIEKEIKNVIQVASWKDRNVETLKQSATSSHNRLLRHVRKYRKLLAQPVAPLLVTEISMGTLANSPAIHIVPDSRPGAASHTFQSAMLHITAWENRPARFVNVASTTTLMRSKVARLNMAASSAELSRFGSDVHGQIKELQEETPAMLNEDSKNQVQDLKRRKRRLLADVIRDAQHMGFQRSMADDALSRQHSLHAVLCRVPALAEHPPSSVLAGATHYFHRFLNILPSVRDSARKHSNDLTPAEAARCMTLLESVLQTSTGQRSGISIALEHSHKLRHVLTLFSSLASAVNLDVQRMDASMQLLAVRLRCLSRVVRAGVELVDAQAHLAGISLLPVTQELSTQVSDLAKLEEAVNSDAPLPAGIGSAQSASLHTRSQELLATLETTLHRHMQSHPELRPILEHILHWSSMELSTEPKPNGYIQQEPNDWVQALLRVADLMLSAVQDVEEAGHDASLDTPGWLVHQAATVDARIRVMRAGDVTRNLDDLLDRLHHLALSNDCSLAAVAGACHSLLPLLDSYGQMCQAILDNAVSLHYETNKLGHQLAASFLQLAQRGFCTPPEKGDAKDAQAGDVEAGTGLGDGEGGEDISKDVGDEEDLTELAQEAQANGKAEDLGDERDAVDMADQELEGGFEDEPEGSETGAGSGDDSAEADEPFDEEVGSVDDQGPSATDEKMWDEGDDGKQPDKESDEIKGTGENNDVATAQDGKQQKDDREAGAEETGEEEAPAEENEHVESRELDQIDPHLEQERNLELPTDIDMGGTDSADDAESDFDGMSEDGHGELDAAEIPDDTDARLDREASEGDGVDDPDREDSPTIDLNAGEDAEREEDGNNDEALDVLTKDDQNALKPPEPADDMTGETGHGTDQKQEEARDAAAKSAEQEDAADGGLKEPEDEKVDTGGTEASNRAPEAGTDTQAPVEDEKSLPVKQIGDVLEEWYRQHRQIEPAQQPGDTKDSRPEDMDLSNTRFEHLPDQDADGDTQALGTGTAEQSTALDEDSGLPTKDEEDAALPPDSQVPDDRATGPELQQDNRQIEMSDSLRPEIGSSAFVGEPRAADVDIDMQGELFAEDEDLVQGVDKQLTDIHLGHDRSDEGLSPEDARKLWSDHEANTRNLALVLTEHLRL